MQLADVQHQPRAHRVLQRAIASRRMPHAYLFGGPDGVGKEMMAVGLAQTLLCTSPLRGAMPGLDAGEQGIDACGQCDDCRLVQAGTHPDLLLIYRQLNRLHDDSGVRKQKALFLTVDVIRQFVIDKAGMSPTRGRARVFVIREAERMNDAAQNSLLKTLEEPPRSTFLILLATALDRMLPTTRSRCQQIPFAALPTDFVRQKLEELRPDAAPAAIDYASQRAGGSLGAALKQINDGIYALKGPWGDRLVQLARGGRGVAPHEMGKALGEDAKGLAKLEAERDPDVSDTDATRAGLKTLLSVLSGFYLDALRRSTGAQLPLINADQPQVIDVLAQLQPAALTSALHELNEADANLSRNASIDLTLEAMFISIARARSAALLV